MNINPNAIILYHICIEQLNIVQTYCVLISHLYNVRLKHCFLNINIMFLAVLHCMARTIFTKAVFILAHTSGICHRPALIQCCGNVYDVGTTSDECRANVSFLLSMIYAHDDRPLRENGPKTGRDRANTASCTASRTERDAIFMRYCDIRVVPG